MTEVREKPFLPASLELGFSVSLPTDVYYPSHLYATTIDGDYGFTARFSYKTGKKTFSFMPTVHFYGSYITAKANRFNLSKIESTEMTAWRSTIQLGAGLAIRAGETEDIEIYSLPIGVDIITPLEASKSVSKKVTAAYSTTVIGLNFKKTFLDRLFIGAGCAMGLNQNPLKGENMEGDAFALRFNFLFGVRL